MYEYDEIMDTEYSSSNYWDKIFSSKTSSRLFNEMIDSKHGLKFKPEKVIVYGKLRNLKRKTVSYGDRGLTYEYSGVVKKCISWRRNSTIQEIKERVEYILGEQFNYVLVQLYEDGDVEIGWHSDSESDLEPSSTIASVSFGAVRTFRLRSKPGLDHDYDIYIDLEHGSLLTMEGDCQEEFQHCLPKRLRVHEPRINLTFRKIITDD